MNEDFQKLKDVGAQKIHEATHISKQHVQSILNESFEGMSKVQFLGFISILEREFHLQLDDLKESGRGYFGEKPTQNDAQEEAKVFVTPANKKSYKKLYIVVAIIIFLFVAIFTISNISSSNDTQLEVPDNTTIENIQESIILEPVVEENLSRTQENNASDMNATKDEVKIVQQKAVVKSFKVIPKVKLWMGYIDLSDYKKYQKLTNKELALDPEKDWLLSLGHGYVNFEVDGELQKFNIKKNVKFLYKDGELEKISSEEFKRLNRGHKW